MKNYLILLFFIPFFLLSCKSNPSRQQVLVQYTSILKQIIKANEVSQPFLDKLNTDMDIAYDPIKFIDHDTLEALNHEYIIVQNNLENRIASLETISETDTSFNLKQRSIEYLKDCKIVFMKMYLPLSNMLPKGLKNLTVSEKFTLKSIGPIAKDFAKRGFTFSNILIAYNDKYKFSMAELKHYGI